MSVLRVAGLRTTSKLDPVQAIRFDREGFHLDVTNLHRDGCVRVDSRRQRPVPRLAWRRAPNTVRAPFNRAEVRIWINDPMAARLSSARRELLPAQMVQYPETDA